MTALTFSLRSVVTECGPDYYVVVGRLKGLSPAARNCFDGLLHVAFGEISLSLLLDLCPDGLILQRGGECFVTRGKRKEPFDPNQTGWTNTRQAQLAPDMTQEDWARLMVEVKRLANDWELRYVKGNRHLL